MPEKLQKPQHRWTFVTAAPAREVFAVAEQMAGIPPFRFEVVGPSSARLVEYERNGLFGQWRQLARRAGDGGERAGADGATLWKTRVRWVTVDAEPVANGTAVTVQASAGRGALERALQVVQLLSRGATDRRTIYRERPIPAGPVSLVASWAGTPYPVYLEPDLRSGRGEAILTASRVEAIGEAGSFVKVRLEDGAVGYVERDQIVPAPEESTRAAQPRAALNG